MSLSIKEKLKVIKEMIKKGELIIYEDFGDYGVLYSDKEIENPVINGNAVQIKLERDSHEKYTFPAINRDSKYGHDFQYCSYSDIGTRVRSKE